MYIEWNLLSWTIAGNYFVFLKLYLMNRNWYAYVQRNNLCIFNLQIIVRNYRTISLFVINFYRFHCLFLCTHMHLKNNCLIFFYFFRTFSNVFFSGVVFYIMLFLEKLFVWLTYFLTKSVDDTFFFFFKYPWYSIWDVILNFIFILSIQDTFQKHC